MWQLSIYSFGFQGDLWWWIQNPKCMDQFAIQAEGRDGINLGIFWNAKGQDPYPVNEDAHRLVSSYFTCKPYLIFFF